MFPRLIPYLCLLVSLTLLVFFCKDISCYYKLLAARRAELEREEIVREETLSRLRRLIQLEEKEDIDSNNKKRWSELGKRLQIED